MATLEDICNKINEVDNQISKSLKTGDAKLFESITKIVIIVTSVEGLELVKNKCNIRLIMDILYDYHCPGCFKYNGPFLFEDFVEHNPCIETVLKNLKIYLDDQRLKNPIIMYITDVDYIEKLQKIYDKVYIF